MKKRYIVLIVVAVLFIVCLIIRGINMSKKKQEPPTFTTETVSTEDVSTEELTEDVSTENPYEQGVDHIENGDDGDGRIEVTTTEEVVEEVTTEEPYSDYYETGVVIFDNTAVPKTNMDGSSCKNYLNSVDLSDFGTKWGTSLTEADKYTKNRVLVGVSQNPEDMERGNLQSVGWLIDNLSTLDDSTAIKFTNLHTIGSLSVDHVAILCSYDWYSAFGLKETLVMFEDISGTLNVNDFHEGDIFSATVYVHNVKIVKVNGHEVVCVQYSN